MKIVLVVLYVVLIIMNAVNAGLNLKNNKPAIINIVSAVLWIICLIIHL